VAPVRYSLHVKGKPRHPLARVGWREWASFPNLGVEAIKAKVDTGARTSALHAVDTKAFERDAQTWVRFGVVARGHSEATAVPTEAALLEWREVRSSNGVVQRRPVIVTTLYLGDGAWSVELTLTDRSLMGFQLLLGRQALRNKVVVDPARSFLLGRTPPDL